MTGFSASAALVSGSQMTNRKVRNEIMCRIVCEYTLIVFKMLVALHERYFQCYINAYDLGIKLFSMSILIELNQFSVF